ncbi:TetR/AcrR family transcriptional regulator [Cryptosporangium phraense]|nr:TetR/AcrR family transcriptional regulator [Cryptosporangium phraense]
MSSSPEANTAARRPQAERSQETRLRILDAAVELLIEGGYARANTLAIQAKAGVSRGRLLHQFPSKEELLVAAAHHVLSLRREQGGERALPVDPAERIDAVVEGLWRSFNEPQFWAATELWVASRTEPALADVIRPAERRLGREIWASLDGMFGPELAAHPLYPVVRNTLFTSMRGVALAYAFDERDPTTEPSLRGWKQLAKEILLTK